jgi:hypothetical protein
MHPLANIGDVGKNRFFVSFSVNGGRSDRVSLLARVGEEGRVGCVK